MPGPIFVTHSSVDRDDVNALTEALRATFNGDLRTFNTSSGTAIAAGANWRERILGALKDSPVVILWATAAGLESQEVAFEVGAAYAFGQLVLPCCIHISPRDLPWSLSERHALLMDSPAAWTQLAQAIADRVNYANALNLQPLKDLAERYQAPANALSVVSLGYTLEFRNDSNGPVSQVLVVPSDPLQSPPEWAGALDEVSLMPNQSVVILRDETPEQTDVDVSWTDITGTRRQRSVHIGPTASRA